VKPGQKASPGKTPKRSVASVMKKVRMTEDEAHGLSVLAKGMGKTESEVLREGIALVRAQEERDEAIEDLIAMIEGEEPPKPRWRSA
jgi:predicted DNA-binding protein